MTLQMTDPERANDLLRQGVEASQLGRSDDAVRHWSGAIAAMPRFPEAHYLLGAEYAHVGRYAEAAVELTLAVDQAPDLLAARVQLALLWLTLQAPSQTELIAKPLLDLSPDTAYHHFGAGLVALCRGDHAAAVQALRTAQSRPIDNAPLAADMAMLLKALTEQLPAASPSGASDIDHQAAISAYTRQRH